jgi:hypothetical protein
MSKKTCLIYGHDGFDLCILYNIITFYKSLGFRVFFSNTLADADLLVVLRIPPGNISSKNNDYDVIHVYDYVGSDYKPYFDMLDFKKALVFCSSDNRKNEIIASYPQYSNRVIVALAPVITKFWAHTINPSASFNIIHIGNCKPYYSDGTDLYSNRFLNIIKNKKADVWGAGWDMPDLKANAHGKLSIFKVPEICRNAVFALGMMYPFQREVTFSSRFWQAPLNGCTLLSEPCIYAGIFPGIVETDYSEDSVEQILNAAPDRLLIQQTAIKYWDDQYAITYKIVSDCLHASSFSGKKTWSKNTAYYKHAFINIIRKIKQKYS